MGLRKQVHGVCTMSFKPSEPDRGNAREGKRDATQYWLLKECRVSNLELLEDDVKGLMGVI
jgi:hypothetical protein